MKGGRFHAGQEVLNGDRTRKVKRAADGLRANAWDLHQSSCVPFQLLATRRAGPTTASRTSARRPLAAFECRHMHARATSRIRASPMAPPSLRINQHCRETASFRARDSGVSDRKQSSPPTGHVVQPIAGCRRALVAPSLRRAAKTQIVEIERSWLQYGVQRTKMLKLNTRLLSISSTLEVDEESALTE